MAAQGKSKGEQAMKKGLVLGKFMPLHNGHLALIDFAANHCDELTVLLCHHNREPIAGEQRKLWLAETLANRSNTRLVTVEYNPVELTESSTPDEGHAKAWAEKIKTLLPPHHFFFSSEAYGDAFAAAFNAQHIVFDKARTIVPVSALLIRQKPLTYWNYLPETVQPWFVKKVVLLGSESTGKSTLAERLALHYNTSFVPEMAREIVSHTAECTQEDLQRIATVHAQAILDKTKTAARILICDTDLLITKSYSRFLFGQELQAPPWVEEANGGHLYLFLQTDCPFVQDGTRLPVEGREALHQSHLREVERSGVSFKFITGHWDNRFAEARRLIDQFICSL